MSSTQSTAHRRDFCRALYLQPSNAKCCCDKTNLTPSNNKFISCDKSSSTAANELSRQWAVPRVQPIASKFAERCI